MQNEFPTIRTEGNPQDVCIIHECPLRNDGCFFSVFVFFPTIDLRQIGQNAKIPPNFLIIQRLHCLDEMPARFSYNDESQPSRILLLPVNQGRQAPHADPQLLSLSPARQKDSFILTAAAQKTNQLVVFRFGHRNLLIHVKN